jgi:hypothetical protein
MSLGQPCTELGRSMSLRDRDYGKEMPCAANMAEFLRFQPMAVSKPLKSHDPIGWSQKTESGSAAL